MKDGDLYRPRRKAPWKQWGKERRFRQRLLAAEKKATKVLVVSHGHCLDGVGSVIMTLRALGTDGIGIAYVQPGQMADVLECYAGVPSNGRTMMMADLSLNPEAFERIVAACARLHEDGWRIEWRDHHHKQWEGLDLDRLRQYVAVLEVNDDQTESGASLQQQALCPDDKFAKRLAETIRDRDLWWNKTPDSETLEFAITELGTAAFTRHFLNKDGRSKVVDTVIQKAADRQRRSVEEDTDTLLEDAVYYDADGGRVGVVYGWLPKNVGLHRLLQQHDVRIAINVRPNGKMSLRSRKDAPVTHLVARHFSGGGHPNASGGDLGLRGLAYRWYVHRRGRVARTKEVADAAVKELQALAEAA